MIKLGLLWRLSPSFRKDNPHGLEEISPSLDLIETMLMASVRERVVPFSKITSQILRTLTLGSGGT